MRSTATGRSSPACAPHCSRKPTAPATASSKLPIAEVKAAIFGHAEFTAFNDAVTKLFAKWKKANTPLLKGFAKDGHPKALIETIAEDLLATFRAAPLLDAYDVYQHLMDYWAETMQDDCYLIADDGWREAAQPRLIVEDKNKKTKARPDFMTRQEEILKPNSSRRAHHRALVCGRTGRH